MKLKILDGILHILWYLLVTLIIVFAITVSVLHIVAPNLNSHKAYIEQWVSKTLEMPVTINHIKAHWDGIRPEIDLYGVTLSPEKHGSTTSLGEITLDNLHIELNLTKALFALSLQPTGIFADGLNLHVHSTDKGQLSINSLLSASQQSGVKNIYVGNLVAWLQSQQLFVITNSNFYFKLGGAPIDHVYVKHLRLRNNGYLHEFFVTFSHDKTDKNRVNVGLRAHGDLTKPAALSLNAYAKFHQFDLTSWWQQPIAGYQIKQAMVNGEVWLNWDDDQWQASYSNLNIAALKLYSLKRQQIIPLEQFSGNVAWQPKDNGWQVSANQLFAVINHHAWPETSFSLNKQIDTQQLTLGYVDIQDAERLARALIKVPSQWLVPLNALQPSGELSNINFSHQGTIKSLASHFQFKALLNNVAVSPYHRIPAMSGLDGSFRLKPREGQFDLNSTNLIVDFPYLFTHSLTAGDVKANVVWRQQGNRSWLIEAKNVALLNQDAAVAGNIAVLLPADKQKPILSMMLGYYEKNPAIIKQYFPQRIFDKKLLAWLNQAFISGKPAGGTFILRGPLSSYPYLDHRGIFMADTFMHDLQFQYGPGWPVLKNVNGELIFHNDDMLATVKSASTYNTQLTHLNAAIPALVGAHDLMLNVSGVATGPVSDALRFLEESPLSETIGSHTRLLKADGPVSTILKLRIPLKNPEHTQVDGEADLQKVQVSVPAWGLVFNQLQGGLHFTENGLSATNLKANFLGFPATASLQTIVDENGHMIMQANMASQFSMRAVSKAFKLRAFPSISGTSHYMANLSLHASAKDLARNTLTLNTDLDGLTIKMPKPIGKAASTKTPLKVNVTFGENSPVNLFFSHKQNNYLIKGALSFHPNKNNQLSLYSGDFAFGDVPANIQKEPGIVVQGYMPGFNWKAWYAFYNMQQRQSQKEKGHLEKLKLAYIPRLIDLTFGHLTGFNQVLAPVNIKFRPQLNHYNVLVNNQNINGSINIPMAYPKGILTANFNKLYLAEPKKIKKSSATRTAQVNPATFPAIKMNIKHLKLGKKQIGGVYLETEPQLHGLLIKQLKFLSEQLSGKLAGAWSLIGGQDHTSLSGYLSTNSLTSLNKVWGVNSSLQANAGNVRFQMGWPAAPYNLSVKTASGNAVVNLGSGTVLIDSESTAAKLNLGRIVSLLSIDNIFTGFTGLAKKGYGFDTMHAEAGFNQGIVQVNNTYFQGPVARLDFSGFINTIKKTLNLNLMVTPHVTSSLPIIAGVATLNPLVGVATYVAEKLFSPAVNSVISRRYLVSGSFDKPVIKRLQGASAEKTHGDFAGQNELLRD